MSTPHIPVALSLSAHDRVADRRTDEPWLAQVWSAPTTRVLVLSGPELVVPEAGSAPWWVSPQQAPDGLRLLLGEHDGGIRFAVVTDEPPAGASTEVLRSFVQELPGDEAALVVHAVALAEWHASHLHCPRCGTRLVSEQAGHVKRCPACGRQQFPRTDPAVIMLVTDEADRCLLGRNPRWPEGRYSTLAGFVEPGESFEQAVAREVLEESGVRVVASSYFGNQPWPFPASLMVGFFARASTTDITVDGVELESARWLTREQMRAEAEAGTLHLPGGISISRSLIETWYGGPLPGEW